MNYLYNFLGRIKSMIQKSSFQSPPSNNQFNAEAIRFSESGLEVTLDSSVVGLAIQAKSEMMDSAELLYLAAALKIAQLTFEDIVVEIGTYVGRTAVFMHNTLIEFGNTQTPILSVDPFERYQPNDLNAQGIYQHYLKNILAANAGKRCMPLVAFSQDAFRVVPDNVGLLIVDGDHTYEGTSNDLNLYFDKVRPGGLAFLDDYFEQAYPGVFNAFNDFVSNRSDCIVLHKSYFAIAQRI